LDIAVDIRLQSDRHMSTRARATLAALIEAARPYLAAVLIVTILLTIWIGLRAA
jgi:hypothetical protein